MPTLDTYEPVGATVTTFFRTLDAEASRADAAEKELLLMGDLYDKAIGERRTTENAFEQLCVICHAWDKLCGEVIAERDKLQALADRYYDALENVAEAIEPVRR